MTVEFEDLLREAEADPDVVGVVLGGSRGKGALVTARSDHDVWVIVRAGMHPGRGRGRAASALFRDAERLARARGLGEVIDGWEPDVPFLRGDPSIKG